jgi:hypothetical protein
MPAEVTVRKAELLERLTENRARHRELFEQACDGYRKQAIEAVEERVAQIRGGKLIALAFALPLPEDHTGDYDRAIMMVKMEVEDTIDLTESEFAQLVMDDWAWKRQWVQTTSNYVSM